MDMRFATKRLSAEYPSENYKKTLETASYVGAHLDREIAPPKAANPWPKRTTNSQQKHYFIGPGKRARITPYEWESR